MSIYRYPKSLLLWDGLRAGFGLAATLGPVLFLDVVRPFDLILVALGLVFFWFALRVVEQWLSSIDLSDQGIKKTGLIERGIAWSELADLKLAHYATPRRPAEGWYQLSLKGNGQIVKLESTIDGFQDIVAAAAGVAQDHNLALDITTTNNLAALGHQRSRAG